MTTKTQIRRTLPGPDGEFDLYVHNLLDQLKADPAAYGISETKVMTLEQSLTTWDTSYIDSLAARDAAKAAVEVKDEVRTDIEGQVRSLIRVIQANDDVTNAAREKAGIAVHKTTRTPVPVPTTSPVGFVMDTNRLEHTLRIADANTPIKRGKPFGVVSCEIYLVVSNVAPTNPEDYRFLKLVTRSQEVITFSAEDGGQTANYLLRWVNTKGETGPWSPTLSATIPAV